jgi:acetyl-CoA acetyltransferase family protein
MALSAHIIAAVRTPIGRYGGALAGVRPDDLAAHVVRAAIERAGLPKEAVNEVVLGAVNQAGEDNRNVARMAVLLAGLPVQVPGYTVNRLCGSGLQAVVDGATLIAQGMAEVVVAGGVESMSRAPWVLAKPTRAFDRAPEVADTSIGWRFANPKMPGDYLIPMGEGAERLAERYGISRSEQDAFAVESHERALTAARDGRFATELVVTPAGNAEVSEDEGPRADASVDVLANLRPAFRPAGTVTAGNSSGLNDGAAAVVLASSAAIDRYGLDQLATIRGAAAVGVSPPDYGLGPVPAIRRLLDREQLRLGDVDLWEINEAFAAQVLACNRELKIPRDRLNVNGGAIAFGHPLGSSGARLVATLVHELRRRGGGLGVASLCVAVGQGIAALLEA